MTQIPNLPIRKTLQEIIFYKEHGPLFGEVLLNLKAMVDDGHASTADLKEMFRRNIYKTFPPGRKRNVSFPFKTQRNHLNEEFGESICISCNDTIAHGRASSLKQGDIVSIDCGIAIKHRRNRWLHFDAAFTTIYGKLTENIEPKYWINTPQQALINITRYQPNDTHRLAQIINDTATKSNLQIVVSLTGHGIGHSLHEAPIVHNMPGNYIPVPLFENMVFCAEPIFAQLTEQDSIANVTNIAQTCLESDGWGVSTLSGAPSSHFETMFAIINGQIIDLIGVSRWEL